MKRAIGIFDSGVGGLTVVKEMLKYLPAENILYFGDVARIPYGSKSPDEILLFVREIIDWMLTFDVKAVAMACNTSSALALDIVRKEYPIPIFGLITPTARYIESINSSVAKIGVIATAATVKSQAYSRTINSFSPDTEIIEVACPGLVEIIESGQLKSKSAYNEVSRYISPLIDAGVDKIILGCTHYPYLAPVITDLTGRNDLLINPAEYMVREMKAKLEISGTINTFNPSVSRDFFVSAGVKQFAEVGSRLLPDVLTDANVKLQEINQLVSLAVS